MRQKARNKRPRRKNCTPIRLHRAPVGSAGASQPQLAIAASASWPRTRPARPLGRKRKGRGRRRRRKGGKGCARQGAGWGVHHRVQNGRMPCHAFPNTRDRTSRTTKRPCALRLHRCVHSLPVWRLGSIGRRTLGCGHRYRQRKQPGPQNCRMGILLNSRHGGRRGRMGGKAQKWALWRYKAAVMRRLCTPPLVSVSTGPLAHKHIIT